MSFSATDFIKDNTIIGTSPLVPEIRLYLATEVTPLWQMTEERLEQAGLPPPYWAFAWPGGQGMARYILDHPEVVKGQRVLDFAAGCGIAAIAAVKAGASHAMSLEIDPLALAVIPMNASLNATTVERVVEVDFSIPFKGANTIIAGDVCYQQAMAVSMLRWLRLSKENGVRVFLADPGRAYVPKEGLEEKGSYVVPTSRDLEDQDSRTVTVWEMV